MRSQSTSYKWHVKCLIKGDDLKPNLSAISLQGQSAAARHRVISKRVKDAFKQRFLFCQFVLLNKLRDITRVKRHLW